MRMLRGLLVVPCLLVSACTLFPAPTPPVPLTKAEVGALAKCQKSIQKGQQAFVKSAAGTLNGCLAGVLAAQLAFESSLIAQGDLDAALVKMREKCTKAYAKINAASTKRVDAIVKGCTPVESFVLGPYDGLRIQSLFAQLGSMLNPGTEGMAGALCGLDIASIYAQVWDATPRMMELLTALGPEYVVMSDADSGFPNIPLDPRCPAATPP